MSRINNVSLLATSVVLTASLVMSAFAQKQSARDQAYLIKEIRHELVMLPYYNLFDWLEFEVQGDGVVGAVAVAGRL
jgi:hypothetical protein